MTEVSDEDCGEDSGKATVREFVVTSRYSHESEENCERAQYGYDLNPLLSGYWPVPVCRAV